jgi:hypothetical protein
MAFAPPRHSVVYLTIALFDELIFAEQLSWTLVFFATSCAGCREYTCAQHQ